MTFMQLRVQEASHQELSQWCNSKLELTLRGTRCCPAGAVRRGICSANYITLQTFLRASQFIKSPLPMFTAMYSPKGSMKSSKLPHWWLNQSLNAYTGDYSPC